MSSTIGASPEIVYVAMAKPGNWLRMNPDCLGVEHVRNGVRLFSAVVAEPGDRITQYVLAGGELKTARWEVTAAAMGRAFALRERSTGTTVTWHLAERDGLTEASRESGDGWSGDDASAYEGLRRAVEAELAELGLPIVRDRGTGEISRYYTETNERVVGRTESGGRHASMRAVVHPESAPPLHIHTREDESWTVLSGTLRFWIGGRTLDRCEVTDVTAGGYVFGPRFVPHTFKTLTPESEVVITNNPGGVEEYFDAIGAADRRRDADHGALFERFGLVVFPDQVPE